VSPFLAVAQGKIANPLVLIDECEKAATRSDYGRLWNCLLGFLEPETRARYPDPALQTNLDLSHVSFVATANRLDPLPSPIRDRFRVVTFPKPSAGDRDALLPAVIASRQRPGVGGSWEPPLDGAELAAVARCWRGGVGARCAACAVSSTPSCATATSAPRGTDHGPRGRREAETNTAAQSIAVATTDAIAGDRLAHSLSHGLGHMTNDSLSQPIFSRPREGRRRAFSEEDKRRIIEEAVAPGVSLSATASPRVFSSQADTATD
jgi:hypothetical protein